MKGLMSLPTALGSFTRAAEETNALDAGGRLRRHRREMEVMYDPDDDSLAHSTFTGTVTR
jgi:hypothetical protein